MGGLDENIEKPGDNMKCRVKFMTMIKSFGLLQIGRIRTLEDKEKDGLARKSCKSMISSHGGGLISNACMCDYVWLYIAMYVCLYVCMYVCMFALTIACAVYLLIYLYSR